MRLLQFLMLCMPLAAAGPRIVSQPAVMHDNFQSDSLGQWASYPPVQDIGYDPSLSPTSEYGAPGGRSLMRILQPASDGLMRLGFIKKLDMVAAPSVRVTFSYRLKPVTPGAEVEVGLAGADGHRYTATVKMNAADGWSQASAAFPQIPAETGIRAVYITAEVAHPDTDAEYRFLLDDVSLAASKPARFDVRTPKSTAIPPFQSLVSSVTYAPGEAISVEAAAPVVLSNASYLLKDQDGRTVSSGALVFRAGVWSGDKVYKIQPADATGIWHLALHGIAPDGRSVDTDVRVIVRRPRNSVHPRLYFGPQDRPALLARTQDRELGAVWKKLAGKAAAARGRDDLAYGGSVFRMLDQRYLLPTLPGYFDIINRASNRILYNALEASVTGSAESRKAAVSGLLDAAQWSRWAPPWFEAHGQHTYYPAGLLTADVAFAYDALYEDLSGAQRDAIRRALMERGIKAANAEYVTDNRGMAGTSNWIGHAVGGGILACLALLEAHDDPELNLYIGGFLMKLEDHLAATYLSDGSYGEGVSYQEFDLESTTVALSALDRVLGIDYWRHSFVKDSLSYPLYTMAQPIGHSLGMGDSHHPSGVNIAAIVQHSADPVVRWYYNQFEHQSITDFLFPPDTNNSTGPAKPVSRVFDRKGEVVFRTGWGPDDAILLFRAGPNFNHNHADQGGFLFRAMGEDLAVEGGYADYYKDPYYRTYFSQAAGHNTVLVDGDPASQEVADTRQYAALKAFPHITDVITSDFYNAVGSELASVYRGRLEGYTRRVVFLKPGYLVICDDLLTRDKAATFDWLLHVSDRAGLQTEAHTALYQAPRAAMALKAVGPDQANIVVKDGYLPYSTFSPVAPKTPPAQPGIIRISSGPPSNSTRFLIALAVARTGQQANAMLTGAQKATGQGCAGVAIGERLVMFQDRASLTCSYGPWRTDAKAWSSAGEVVAAQAATSLRRGDKTLLASDHPVSIAARYGSGAVELVSISDQAVAVRIFTGFRPGNMQAGDYNQADGTVQLHLSAGRHEMRLAR